MLLKECRRCGRMIPYPHTYCDGCQVVVDKIREQRQKEHKQTVDRNYNKRRDPKYVRFYNSNDWKILSAKYMQSQGYRCQGCGAIATEVHHVKPIQTDEGWKRRLDWDNLEAVCVGCHNKRHGRFQGRRNKGKYKAIER